MFTDFSLIPNPAVLVAYLDPGMGSMYFQILLATLLSATFFVKSSLLQARDFLGRVMKKAN